MKVPGLTKSTIAWAMYDFANSAFATSVMSVIFSIYYTTVLVPAGGVSVLGFLVPGESLWGYLISAVMFSVICLSPALGALADHRAWKRRFLTTWALVGSIGTMFLMTAAPGHLIAATVF